MTSRTIAVVETKTGKPAIVITARTIGARVLYSYTGAWGAGCGDLIDIISKIRASLATRRGWRVLVDDCGLTR